MPALASSPPQLPIPRQPSPLSFSSMSAQDPPSPPASSSSLIIELTPTNSSPPSSRLLHNLPGSDHLPLPTQSTPLLQQPISPNSRDSFDRLPVEPLPDSLLLRSTFTALDHSATTLKRMSKSVLASTRAYLALLEQVERAEEELFQRLGELGRWLESGYGISGASIWDDENGIRKIRKNSRRREREEVEVMVEHSVKAVKGELKRNGLAGLGAQTHFETNAKQFYQQTSDYLSPQSNSQENTQSQGRNQLLYSSAQSPSSAQSDLAQAARLAQFDVTRYSHHSTLLYAVPPTSIACVDLLVSLYSWAGGLLGEVPEARKGSFTRRETEPVPSKLGSGNGTGLETPLRSPVMSESMIATTPKALKSTLSISLEHLASIRSNLLSAWAKRNSQTTELEETAAERQAELDGGTITDLPNGPTSPRYGEGFTPNTLHGIENKRAPRKMHKLHRSVGGKLRELLSSSGSSRDLISADRGERSLRLSQYSGQTARPVSIVSTNRPISLVSSPPSMSDPLLQTPAQMPSVATPARRPSTTSPRPSIQPRHSMHATRASEYVSPFLASQAQAGNLPLPFDSSPDLRSSLKSPVQGTRLGGVGGLGAGGDEDERREEVGRKKEGVLWGAGVWEGLTRAPTKAKWEKMWVVLDHSSIYEYRDANFGKPETAHAVIDLKFASVREGRQTDRRFVFEVVTPTKGRRFYQATSDSEMKQWLYAICNAIESCINGTSSVRTFDTSKLRTVSGSLDDHAIPTSTLFPIPSRGIGIGLPGARRSMPPPRLPVDDGERRQRKTSLKKVLRQSAEIAGEKWSSVMSNRNASSSDLPRPGFLGQTGRSGSKASNTHPIEENPRPKSMILQSSLMSNKSSNNGESQSGSSRSTVTEDDIEKRVLEMAGLGLGVETFNNTGSTSSGRRVVSDGATNALAKLESRNLPTLDTSRTRSAEPPQLPQKDEPFQVDMALLRHVAEIPSNKVCADCGKSMKSSRWATISLCEVPMVLFLCIRCVGIHRGLGVRISKPRSVDLDLWNPETILLAREWGNERCNVLWEAKKPVGYVASDEDIGDYIKTKYVERKWLSDEGRLLLGLGPLSPASPRVGRAI